MNAEDVIKHLGLHSHPQEDGYFVETYRSKETVKQGSRSLSTAIHYLLTPDTFSAIHRLPGDEIYHFYIGDPVELLLLKSDGSGEVVILGNDLAKGIQPQFLVPKNTWQGSRLADGGKWALLGTTMAPGFDFEDNEMGKRDDLKNQYPEFSEMIGKLTLEN